MITPPPEVIKAARLVTQWAAENNLQQFAIEGIQNRIWAHPTPGWPFPTWKPTRYTPPQRPLEHAPW